jgi:hypothetical protein
LGDAGFGYFELLESLWVVLAKTLRSTLASQWHPGFGWPSSKDVTDWVKKHFRSTVTSRRQAAIAKHEAARKLATTCAALT